MAKEQTKIDQANSVEHRLRSLYELQTILSEIDRIRTIRGELPEEVRDLEDIIAGLHTRIDKYNHEIEELRSMTAQEQNKIHVAQEQIATYKTQLDNVRNNREFDLLSKEIEYQTLEIQLSAKRIGQYAREIETKTAEIASAQDNLTDRNHILAEKRQQLEESSQRPRRTRKCSAPRPKTSKHASTTPAHSPHSSASARTHATASESYTSSVTHAADASTASRPRSRWRSRCTKRLSCANTAAAS